MFRHAILGMVLLAAFVGVKAMAQVRSVTLGIRTHCPYGIRGCWPEIRDGLETPKAITAITGDPDIKTDTCEVKMREDWNADPEMFQRNFLEMRIGVDVRGVEAVVDGHVAMEGTNLVLRVGSTGTVLVLAPLGQKVQWDKERKQPQVATHVEKNAFSELAARFKAQAGQVRITGPLRSSASGRILEVRKFEVVAKKA
jgi:hypothetical protein